MSIATGVAFWAFLTKTNEMSHKYQMDLGRLDAKTIKAFQDEGITVKTDEKFKPGEDNYRGKYVTLKAGEDFKPKVVDAKKRALPVTVLVGNGSKVNVVWNAYDWTFKGKKGKAAGLNVVQVLDLVPYNDALSELKEADGYEFGQDAEDVAEPEAVETDVSTVDDDVIED